MNTTARTALRRRTPAILIALAAGTLIPGLALAQSAPGSAAPAAPTPPTAPVRARAIGQAGQPAAEGSVSSSYSMSVNDNGRNIKIEMKNGVVTHAEIDGQAVPDDRIENDGDTVRLKDDKGEVIYEHQLPGDFSWNGRAFSGTAPDATVWRLFNGTALPGLNSLGGTLSIAEPDVSILSTEPFQAPAVMMGVQMGVPDSTLCGHLGIDRAKATLLTAVHEGLPAAAGGLEPYDVIVAVAGTDDADPAGIRAAIKDKKPGDTLAFSVIHKGVRKDVTLTLEAYDRKKLASSKASRIAADDTNDVFAVAAAPEAPIPPLPASIPEQYRKEIEQYMKQNSATPRAWSINRYGGARAPAAIAQSEAHKKLLAEIERQQADAAKQADDASRQAQELARRAAQMQGQMQGQAGNAGDMQERMKRMEQMLEELMNQKLQQQKPQEPKDAGSRS
jgi:hypothetical protein